MKRFAVQLLVLIVGLPQMVVAASPTPAPSPTGSPRKQLAPATSPLRSVSPSQKLPQPAPTKSRVQSTPTPAPKTTAKPTALPKPSDNVNPASFGPAQIPGSAPIGKVQLPKKPGTLDGKVPPMKIVNQRSPIPFVPFEPEDITTRQKISRTTMMKLPNGRQVEAGKYYDALNKTEQSLNAIGYSFRKDKHIKVELRPTYSKLSMKERKVSPLTATTKNKQFEVSKKMADTIIAANARFKKQKLDALAAKGKDKADSVAHPKTQAPGEVYDPNKPYPGKMSPAIKAMTAPVPEFSAPEPSSADLFGDPQYAAISFDIAFKKNLTPLAAYFGVTAKTGLVVLSQELDPAEISIGLSAPLVGKKGVVGSIKPPYLKTLPYNDPNNADSEKLDINGEQGADLNKEVSATITFGPIPVTFAAGAHGKVGIRYGVAISAGGATPAGESPNADWLGTADQATIDNSSYALSLDGHADAFGQLILVASIVAGGEVDLGLCTVGATLGIKGSATIFDGQVSTHANVLLTKDAGGKPHAEMLFYGDYGVKSAMAGQLWIEANVDFCLYSVDYNYYIWDHPGVSQPLTPLFHSEPKGDLF